MFFPFGKRVRRSGGEAFPAAWLATLQDNVLLYRTLAQDEQARLRDASAFLVAHKTWEGCAGLAVSDEMKVTIAGQAALLLLGLGEYRFDELQTILVYPGGFLGLADDELGLRDDVQIRLGEAAHGGPVALSWWHARWGGRRLGPVNVVLHEFAHKLAELGDPETGRPPLLERALEKRWTRVMRAECDRLAEDADYGRPTLLDPYGAESLAEYFAVASETFFLRGGELRVWHPEVYELLSAFYHQDPAARPIPPEVAATARGADEEYSRHVVEECSAALRLRPDYLEAYRERAGARLDVGDVEGAVADWTAVLERAGSDEERSETLYERAGVLAEAGRLDEALADYSEAIRLCPDFAAAYTDRGAVHADWGEQGEALADLEEALRLDPRDDAALIHRARLHHEAGRLDEALRDLNRAARLCPHDAALYRSRARVHLDRQEYARALADLDAALRLAPEGEEELQDRAEALEGLGRPS
jgi:Mlc titration factor MtfA (ptsG expression regulator)/regulator of sirC expression with transglutaminase-like and TPR domain